MASGLVHRLLDAAQRSLTTPRPGWHVLTEARVFWMYLARVVWPAGLCGDRQIAWTVSTDDALAWVALAAEAFARLTWIQGVMDDAHLTHPFYWSAYCGGKPLP